MIENNVSTDPQNVQTELARLKWESDQHKALEIEISEVFAFLAQAIEPDCIGGDIRKFDDSAREGLAHILNRYQGFLLSAADAIRPTFYDPASPGISKS